MSSTFRRLSAAAVALAALGIVTFHAGSVPAGPPGQRVAATSGRALRDWSEATEAMQRTRELRLRAVQDDPLVAGRRHERLDQYYRGVRVFGGEVVRETDGASVVGVTATLHTGIRVDTSPSLDADEALAVFGREVGAARAGVGAVPELVVLPKDNGGFALAYRVTAYVDGRLPVVFVNAKTGAVELSYDNLQTQVAASGIGRGVYGDEKKIALTSQGTSFVASDAFRPTKIVTYDFRGNIERMLSRLVFAPSDVATSTSTTWTDGAVVDTHCYIGWTYDFYYKRFGWKGLDNRDSRAVHAIAHPARREDMAKYLGSWSVYGNFYANASFCTRCGSGGEDVLTFGEGYAPGYVNSRGQYINYYAASLDIVAHEYSHGVTAYSSGLIYRNESGALSEAFSDIMAAAAEFHWQPVGGGRLQSDYLQGEDTYLPSRAGSTAGGRSFQDPAAFGQPDHYSQRYEGASDNGGVHTNSGIANHAFYLAIEGGTDRTSNLSVRGVGFANHEQIEKVFFRGFTTLPSDASFGQARQTTIQAARDLYGAGGAVERAVTEAWTAVGVQ